MTDEFKNWVPDGFQVKTVRAFERTDIPQFARDAESIRRRLLQPYLTRCRIAELYWLDAWPARSIGETLGMSTAAVEQVIYRLRKKYSGD